MIRHDIYGIFLLSVCGDPISHRLYYCQRPFIYHCTRQKSGQEKNQKNLFDAILQKKKKQKQKDKKKKTKKKT